MIPYDVQSQPVGTNARLGSTAFVIGDGTSGGAILANWAFEQERSRCIHPAQLP